MRRYHSCPDVPFARREFKLARFTTPLHFHPEIELTLIVAGRGLRYVGDSIGSFHDGDLVLLGSNLSHYWWNDAADRRHAHSIVVQFLRISSMAAVERGRRRTDSGAFCARAPLAGSKNPVKPEGK